MSDRRGFGKGLILAGQSFEDIARRQGFLDIRKDENKLRQSNRLEDIERRGTERSENLERRESEAQASRRFQVSLQPPERQRDILRTLRGTDRPAFLDLGGRPALQGARGTLSNERERRRERRPLERKRIRIKRGAARTRERKKALRVEAGKTREILLRAGINAAEFDRQLVAREAVASRTEIRKANLAQKFNNKGPGGIRGLIARAPSLAKDFLTRDGLLAYNDPNAEIVPEHIKKSFNPESFATLKNIALELSQTTDGFGKTRTDKLAFHSNLAIAIKELAPERAQQFARVQLNAVRVDIGTSLPPGEMRRRVKADPASFILEDGTIDPELLRSMDLGRIDSLLRDRDPIELIRIYISLFDLAFSGQR